VDSNQFNCDSSHHIHTGVLGIIKITITIILTLITKNTVDKPTHITYIIIVKYFYIVFHYKLLY